jgi:hypothetical protein
MAALRATIFEIASIIAKMPKIRNRAKDGGMEAGSMN